MRLNRRAFILAGGGLAARGCKSMLWNVRSRGTLHNILNLIGAGKKTLVYFAPEKAFYKLAAA